MDVLFDPGFDFAVFDDDGELEFLIEYNGIQHYEARERYGGAKALYRQKYNDLQKRKYCQQHNIKLVAIPYWEENLVDYDYIMKAAYNW